MHLGTVRIAGIEATIGTEAECEVADAYFCVRKSAGSPFTDNLEAPCTWCGETVIFRPYAPKLPPKICTVCMVEQLAADAAGGGASA